jgi:hydroxymethylpyrimidine pyrophosphatase-like HAD family hydrolase
VEQALHDLAVDITYSNNKYLDILPKGVNKGSALRFLAKMWEINLNNIIACGDSGNDISMLQGNKAIVVGNAKSELLEWIHTENESDIYLAKREYAGGMIEGLKHYNVL